MVAGYFVIHTEFDRSEKSIFYTQSVAVRHGMHRASGALITIGRRDKVGSAEIATIWKIIWTVAHVM